MRRKARVDANHSAVRDRYRAYGWYVVDTSSVGDGFPDLIAIKHGRVEFIEIKDGRLSPSKRKLTLDEQRVHMMFAAKGMPIRIITDVDQVTQ